MDSEAQLFLSKIPILPDTQQDRIAGLQQQMHFYADRMKQYEAELQLKNSKLREYHDVCEFKDKDLKSYQEHSRKEWKIAKKLLFDAEISEEIDLEAAKSPEFADFFVSLSQHKLLIKQLERTLLENQTTNSHLNEKIIALNAQVGSISAQLSSLRSLLTASKSHSSKHNKQIQTTQQLADLQNREIAASQVLERLQESAKELLLDWELVTGWAAEVGIVKQGRWDCVKALKTHMEEADLALCRKECEAIDLRSKLGVATVRLEEGKAALAGFLRLNPGEKETVVMQRLFPDLAEQIHDFRTSIQTLQTDYEASLAYITSLSHSFDTTQTHIYAQFKDLLKAVHTQEHLSTRLLSDKQHTETELQVCREAKQKLMERCEQYEELLRKIRDGIEVLFEEIPESYEELVEELPVVIRGIMTKADEMKREIAQLETDLAAIRQANNCKETESNHHVSQMTNKIDELTSIIVQNEGHFQVILQKYEEAIAAMRLLEEEVAAESEVSMGLSDSLERLQQVNEGLLEALYQAESRFTLFEQVHRVGNFVSRVEHKWKRIVECKIGALARTLEIENSDYGWEKKWKRCSIAVLTVAKLTRITRDKGKTQGQSLQLGPISLFVPVRFTFKRESHRCEELAELTLEAIYTSWAQRRTQQFPETKLLFSQLIYSNPRSVLISQLDAIHAQCLTLHSLHSQE